jgi:hypothetical protein
MRGAARQDIEDIEWTEGRAGTVPLHPDHGAAGYIDSFSLSARLGLRHGRVFTAFLPAHSSILGLSSAIAPIFVGIPDRVLIKR